MDEEKKTVSWHIFFAEFVFSNFYNPFIAIYHINEAKKRAKSVHHNFKIYRMTKKIMLFVKPELIGLQKDNFIEKIVKLEKNMDLIKTKMIDIISKSLMFWKRFKYFKNESLTNFKDTLEQIVDTKYQLLEKWQLISEYVEYNPFFKLYYRWFLKDFINKKITVSEEELNLMSTKTDFQSMDSKDHMKQLKLESVAFYRDSLVIHLDMYENKLGIIKYVK